MRAWLKIVALCVVWCAGAVEGINNPPYEVFPYLADTTDVPPVNYMKVVDPGRTGEGNAAYVVLGISYPRTYQAVSSSYTGSSQSPPTSTVFRCARSTRRPFLRAPA